MIELMFDMKKMIQRSTPAVQKNFYSDVRKFFKALSNKLTKILPLDNSLPLDLQTLHPLLHSQSNSMKAIQKIAKKVPHAVGKDFDKFIEEYRAYQSETDIKEKQVYKKEL